MFVMMKTQNKGPLLQVFFRLLVFLVKMITANENEYDKRLLSLFPVISVFHLQGETAVPFTHTLLRQDSFKVITVVC